MNHTANKIKNFLKAQLHPTHIPGNLMILAMVALLYAYFNFEKEKYQLVAFIFVLTGLFSMGLEGLLIFVYKKYSVGNKVITNWKAYLIAGIGLLIGWGFLAGILVWLFWD
jgi:hypothetical protein